MDISSEKNIRIKLRKRSNSCPSNMKFFGNDDKKIVDESENNDKKSQKDKNKDFDVFIKQWNKVNKIKTQKKIKEKIRRKSGMFSHDNICGLVSNEVIIPRKKRSKSFSFGFNRRTKSLPEMNL